MICWPPVRAVWLNYEVVEFQHWSVTVPNPGSVAYCYVAISPSPLSKLNYVWLTSRGDPASFPILWHRPSCLRTGPSSHLGVPHIRPIIPPPCRLSTGSSAHLKVAYLRQCLPTSFHHFFVACSPMIPPTTTPAGLPLPPPPGLFRNILKNGPQLVICHCLKPSQGPSPPPSCIPIFSWDQTSNMFWRANHCAFIVWRL